MNSTRIVFHIFASLVLVTGLSGCGGDGTLESSSTIQGENKGSFNRDVAIEFRWATYGGHMFPTTYDPTTETSVVTNDLNDEITAISIHSLTPGEYSIQLASLQGAHRLIVSSIGSDDRVAVPFLHPPSRYFDLVPGDPMTFDVGTNTRMVGVQIALGSTPVRIGKITLTRLDPQSPSPSPSVTEQDSDGL